MTEWRREGYLVTDDPACVDLDVVHGYLAHESYWALGRTREYQAAANAGSRCYCLIEEATSAQVGFTRVATDGVNFAWVADVFVLPSHQGNGVGTFLVGCVMEALAPIDRVMLGTRDAHGLYAKFGLASPGRPERLMERLLHPLPPD